MLYQEEAAHINANQRIYNGSKIPVSSLQHKYKLPPNLIPIEYKNVDIQSKPSISLNNAPIKICTSEYNNYTTNKITNETPKNISEVQITPPKYSEIIGSIDASSTTISTLNHQPNNNFEAITMIPTCHFNEISLSNTEKFKNYPMMKALWEARHDLNSIIFFYYCYCFYLEFNN